MKGSVHRHTLSREPLNPGLFVGLKGRGGGRTSAPLHPPANTNLFKLHTIVMSEILTFNRFLSH